MVVAVFSFRYDAALVPALIAHLTPLVHGFVSCDDRGAAPVLSDEPGRRNQLHAAARAMGADWILAIDPDERFEARLAKQIGDLTARRDGRTLWIFNQCEMASATAYRTDGLWGNKTQMRLYPASATLLPLTHKLHGTWVAPDLAYRAARTGLNLYHLRHATSERTQLRRDTYAAADPERRFQHFGYDYLTDMRCARLTEIGPDRHFTPPHVEDGGLWASSAIDAIGRPCSDPLTARLGLIAVLCRQNGADGAAYVAEDLWRADPSDTDLQMVAAGLALRAGRAQDAMQLALGAKSADQLGFAQVIRAAAQAALGDKDLANAALSQAVSLVGPSRILAQQQHDIDPDQTDLVAADARWRRWAKAGGRIYEGPRNGTGQLAVIIIGFRSPATLARAVASIRNQSAEVEIVVVNSGGGDAQGLLQADLDHIRLIGTATPLCVGAARNIGIAGSRAPYIAFLAADCVALPGWVAGRLARHGAGAKMVSSAVEPGRPGTVIGSLVELLVFPGRAPAQTAAEALHYGRSYCRTIFAQAGLFAAQLRVGEDTEFHRRTDMLASPVWAPEIRVIHDDPAGLIALLRDLYGRGQRLAIHFRPTAAVQPASDWVEHLLDIRQNQVRLFLQRNPWIGGARTLYFWPALRLSLLAFARGLRHADRHLARAEAAAAAARARSPDDLDAAIRLAGDAVSLAPQAPVYRQLLGELLLKRGTAEDLTHAQRQLAEVLALSPTAAHALWLAATALHKQGRSVEALALCEDAVMAAPEASPVVMVAARAANWAGKPDYALFLAQKALAHDPAFVQAHEFLGQLHRRAGRLTLAEKRNALAKSLREARASRANLT